MQLVRELGGLCACCGEQTFEFLEIDHKDNSGAKFRGRNGGQPLTVFHLRTHMESIQVLCANCHRAKTSFGTCPHVSFRLVDLLPLS